MSDHDYQFVKVNQQLRDVNPQPGVCTRQLTQPLAIEPNFGVGPGRLDHQPHSFAIFQTLGLVKTTRVSHLPTILGPADGRPVGWHFRRLGFGQVLCHESRQTDVCRQEAAGRF
jgi:hypothetical protein